MKIIDHFIVTKGGCRCRLGLCEVLGAPVLIKADDESTAITIPVPVTNTGRNATNARREAVKLITRTQERVNELRNSLLSDWARLAPLLEPGSFKEVAVYVDRPRAARKPKKATT